MDAQTLRDIQGYGAFIFLAVCAALLYGYYFHLYRSEKSGRRNYERYSDLALKDGIDEEILESTSIEQNAKKEK
ncbi:cytochrome c oxidase, cbb3-type, CcoQ subunit [uncultured Campylobacter sp.]|uniref:cytochrome c oxidase, cbb3-type, CcoQ subunit n=1 Tax=uncultured Campylobacter sp. TaxID=218934 RepID=UPI00263A32AE|nr:cytochrome c oxidase, cbb3-type, CcoQ subunit [uncultured Campylobacter sp.]